MARVGLDVDLTGRSPADEAITTATGGFEFHGLADGSHAVYVHKCGYALGTLVVQPEGLDDSQVVLLPPQGQTIHINFLDRHGQTVRLGGVSFLIDGVRVPNHSVAQFAAECLGIRDRYDVDFFPPGMIQMLGRDGALLGSFSNDGSSDLWRVTVPPSPP